MGVNDDDSKQESIAFSCGALDPSVGVATKHPSEVSLGGTEAEIVAGTEETIISLVFFFSCFAHFSRALFTCSSWRVVNSFSVPFFVLNPLALHDIFNHVNDGEHPGRDER